MRIQKPKSRKKLIIASVAAVLIVAGALGFWYKTTHDTPVYRDPLGQEIAGPTEEEQKEADDNKDEVVKQMEVDEKAAESQNTSDKKAVTPTFTNLSKDSQQVTVNSYISGIFEDGGTCVITATKGSSTVSKSVEAFANATTTDCAPAFLPLSDFSGGIWSFTIQYNSPKAAGVSAVRTLAL